MRNPPSLLLLLLLLAACAPAPLTHSAPPPEAEVRCTLLGLELEPGPYATASFRASNGTGGSVVYRGYTEEGPLYQSEVLVEGRWEANPLGWCGTGLAEQRLAPGGSLDFTAAVPRDGRSYRFSFGEPAVRTPPVSAPPP